MFHWKYLMLGAIVVLVGCGPRPQATGSAQRAAPAETVKAALEQLAESGQVGSEAAMMMQALEEMKATDAAKAEALLEDANQLMSASGQQEVKAKAKEMLGKLGGTTQESPPEEAAPEGPAPKEGDTEEPAPKE